MSAIWSLIFSSVFAKEAVKVDSAFLALVCSVEIA